MMHFLGTAAIVVIRIKVSPSEPFSPGGASLPIGNRLSACLSPVWPSGPGIFLPRLSAAVGGNSITPTLAILAR